MSDGTKATYGFVGNGESNWLRKMEANMSVTVRHATLPSTVKAPCGLEFVDRTIASSRNQSLVSLHSKRCKACRRLRDTALPAAVVKVNDTQCDDRPVSGTTLAELLAHMEMQREQALNIATGLDSAISAAKGITEQDLMLVALQVEIQTSREALAAFLSPKA